MFEQIRDVDTKEFLTKKIRENSKTYSEAVLKAVLFREQGSTYLYDGTLNFTHKSENSSSSFTYDYGPVILLQWVINIEESLKLIESLSTENIILNELKNIKIKGGFIQECYHIANRYRYAGVMSDWPCWFSRYSYDSNLGVHYKEYRDSLTAPGLPPYPDLYEATKIFLNLNEDYNPNQNTPVGIQFFIPDYRARIKTLEIAENIVTISIETKETTIDNLLLQFFSKNNSDIQNFKDVKIEKNGVATITLPDVPKEGHVYLLEKNSGTQIDSKSFGRWYTDRTEGIIIKTSKETVESMIAKGENDMIEFKMDLSKDNNEFLETVVAFANTRGGTILLGVHDDRRVVGISDTFENLEKRIRNLVANRCEPDIAINLELVTIENKSIIVITVKEEKNKPYLLLGKSAYKRVIKDDYPLTRHDFDEMYSKKNQRDDISGFAT